MTETSRPSVTRIVAFHLDSQRYGFPIDSVREIQQIVAFTQVPDEADVVRGIINFRGTIIPAVDLRRLLGMDAREYALDTPMVICSSAHGLVAFIVDGVDDVADLPQECIQPAPPMHALSAKMLGVCSFESGMTFLLDVDRVLEPIDIEQFRGGEPA